MKAIVQDTYGSPDVLELRDIDKPMVGDDDLAAWVAFFQAPAGLGDLAEQASPEPDPPPP